MMTIQKWKWNDAKSFYELQRTIEMSVKVFKEKIVGQTLQSEDVKCFLYVAKDDENSIHQIIYSVNENLF